MRIADTEIVDTYAEAFGMWAARVIVTADDDDWAIAAGNSMTGFATSVIRCKCEAAVERKLEPRETPDLRPGVSVLIFSFDREGLVKRLIERIGQCVMTCPTTACYDGLLESGDRVHVGSRLRYFGDGYQISKLVGERRLWRIPVMEGEFLIDEQFGVQRAVGGGNLLISGKDAASALRAAVAGVDAMRAVPGVILPFPQGVVRCGSKPSSKYKGLIASTNDAYCPSLRAMTHSSVPTAANSVFEIVIDGLSVDLVGQAMCLGAQAAAEQGAIQISAGNYGGDLGKYKISLHEVLRDA